MNNEDYASYELALKLKDCGFDEPCNYGYSVKMRLEPEVSFGEPKMVHSKAQRNYNDNRKGIEKGLSFCSAPTLAHAQKWLRESKGIAINVDAHDGDFYTWDGIFLSNATQGVLVRLTFNVGFPSCAKKFLSYEEALSKGIAEVLKLLDNERKIYDKQTFRHDPDRDLPSIVVDQVLTEIFGKEMFNENKEEK